MATQQSETNQSVILDCVIFAELLAVQLSLPVLPSVLSIFSSLHTNITDDEQYILCHLESGLSTAAS